MNVPSPPLHNFFSIFQIAIARAILKNAPILLCDEPTSSLDTQTEIDIMSHLKQLGGGRTALLIAHRLSTVQVLCRGAVVVLVLCYFAI